MAWRIDRDYLDGGTPDNAVGTSQGSIDGPTFGFRLMDDDGEVYYHGVADERAVKDDTQYGGLYEASRWGEVYAGALWLQVRARDGWIRGLVDRRHHTNPDEWITVYA